MPAPNSVRGSLGFSARLRAASVRMTEKRWTSLLISVSLGIRLALARFLLGAQRGDAHLLRLIDRFVAAAPAFQLRRLAPHLDFLTLEQGLVDNPKTLVASLAEDNQVGLAHYRSRHCVSPSARA